MTIEEKFELLKEEIRTASKLARGYFDSEDFTNEQKEDGSVVTEIDKKVEAILREFIQKYFPDDAVIGEESENTEGTSGFVWHVDPIDGTDNFLRKIPFCGVSVARLGDTAEDSFGIVHNPITDHTFASLMDNGVFENERVSKMSPLPLGGTYVVTFGFGRSESWMKPASFKLQEAMNEGGYKCRDFGSTALHLAYLAAGRTDGFLTTGLHSYDYAAGLYLVKAAGGAISVFEDGVWNLYEGSLKELCDVHGKTIFASHPDVHRTMRDFIGNPRNWSNQ